MFSIFVFPWFRWVVPAGWALGPRLPRRDAAALRSLQRPRFGPRAAPRGQGGGGCEEQLRPWPRTGKPPEAMGYLHEVDEMLIC